MLFGADGTVVIEGAGACFAAGVLPVEIETEAFWQPGGERGGTLRGGERAVPRGHTRVSAGRVKSGMEEVPT